MDYLRRFILWFLSGLGASLGVTLVVMGYTELSDLKRKAEFAATLPSSSVTLTEVEPIALPKELTVSAILTNNAAVSVGVRVRLVILQANKVVFECDDSHPETPAPGISSRIQISCQGVDRENVPSGATFEVRVSRVFPVD
jgi:hypothetical protein